MTRKKGRRIVSRMQTSVSLKWKPNLPHVHQEGFTCMHSYPVGLDVWFLVRPFVYFHTSWVRTAKALARLHGCAGSPESSLVACVISIIISWAGSFWKQNECAHSEDSDQPGPPPSLISIFAVRSIGSKGPKLSSCGQRRLIRLGWCPGWSESSLDTQPFCWFCYVVAHLWVHIILTRGDKKIHGLLW